MENRRREIVRLVDSQGSRLSAPMICRMWMW